ncbi:MAG: single-stranded DNA-binding protein [Bacilli bacterium]
MNNVVLVGRLTDNPDVINTENGKQITKITVAVNRNYKNVDGIYETDFIRCVLWNGIAGATCEYCKVGDVIGIKGRIQTSSYENEENKKIYVTEVVAEKVTFLSSNKNKEEKKEEEKPKKSKKQNN